MAVSFMSSVKDITSLTIRQRVFVKVFELQGALPSVSWQKERKEGVRPLAHSANLAYESRIADVDQQGGNRTGDQSFGSQPSYANLMDWPGLQDTAHCFANGQALLWCPSALVMRLDKTSSSLGFRWSALHARPPTTDAHVPPSAPHRW